MSASTTGYDGLPEAAIRGIAALFGAEPQLQQQRRAGIGPIWRVERRSENGNLRLLLWPQIARVDVTCGPHSWIVRGVRRTELLPGLEAIFHFGANGLLTVAPTGHVVMVSPDESDAAE